jgi:hypothetical protein
VISNLTWDPETFNGQGVITASMTVAFSAPASPDALAVSYAGAALLSNYSATATPLIAAPVGATALPPTASSRTGGEGAVPITISPVPTPVPFVRPSTIAALWTGGCRVWDTISTGSNPVPVAGGAYVHANWVEVKGPQHDFIGDCVVTNGLQLLLYAVGSAPAPLVYAWNTSLGTPTWQSIGSIQYQDNSSNVGTLRSIDLDCVGLQEVRVRVKLSTSAGNFVELRQKLQAGCYHTYVEYWAVTETASIATNLVWSSTAVYATGFTDSTSSTTFPSNLTPTTVSGYGAAQGSASGSPLFGWLFQTIPGPGQGRLVTTSSFGFGDTAISPVVGFSALYGFFVAPYAGAVVLATARGIVAPIFQQFLSGKTARWVRG